MSGVDSSSPALVTGGTGFLGRHIVELLLARGRKVSVLARRGSPELEARGVRFITTPLQAGEALEEACRGQNTVFHVAAKVGVWGNYKDFYETNVLGTRALLAACKKAGVRQLVHTSTPSVVYDGHDLAGANECLPLTRSCPSNYPLTKALAEAEVLAANGPELRCCSLRPHLIWGLGDPHLVPRVLERARSGRLRIIGDGNNRVDMVHVRNAAEAHLLAEQSLLKGGAACGRPYFITNGEPVLLWDWINGLLKALGEPVVEKRIPLVTAKSVGAVCELAWNMLRLKGEPPMTRFVAAELAKDHWFDISAARRDLGYEPTLTMEQGTREIIAELLRQKTT